MNGEPEKQELLPTVSLRSSLIAFTISIFFAAVIRQSMMGALWAKAMVLTVACCAVLALLYTIVFFFVWVPARLASENKESPSGSPFSDKQLPPQVIKPNDREVVS